MTRPQSRRFLARCSAPFLGLLLGLALSVSAWAITLEEAARQAAEQHNAKVISARTIKRRGQRIHEIKLLTKDGVVKTVRIPEDSA